MLTAIIQYWEPELRGSLSIDFSDDRIMSYTSHKTRILTECEGGIKLKYQLHSGFSCNAVLLLTAMYKHGTRIIYWWNFVPVKEEFDVFFLQ